MTAEAPRPHITEEEFVPRPCTVSPTPAVEYPYWDLPEELNEVLGERFDEFEIEHGYSYHEVATTQQSKAGGYPGWTQPPNWPVCAGCDTRMEHLLSITATEPGTGRWLPLDDRDLLQDPAATPPWQAGQDPATLTTFGHLMSMGDMGGVYFFICRTCPGTPYTHRYDC
ncbi:hypothetical protein ACWGHA_36115 [Streptomyces xanthophaeus]